jgi:hypothetical protein
LPIDSSSSQTDWQDRKDRAEQEQIKEELARLTFGD